MDDFKLFSKNKKGLETLILVVRIYSGDIEMKFGIEKCVMLMRSRKRQMTEGIELINQEKNQNARRKGNLQILGNIGSGHHQTSGEERKKFLKISQENEKTTLNQTI